MYFYTIKKKKSMAMQRNYFTVLFFLKKSKLLKNGEAPICMHITINGKRAEVENIYFKFLNICILFNHDVY